MEIMLPITVIEQLHIWNLDGSTFVLYLEPLLILVEVMATSSSWFNNPVFPAASNKLKQTALQQFHWIKR